MNVLLEYLQNSRIPTQLLYNNNPYCPNNSPYLIEHESYNDITGLKVEVGPINEHINLICLDIDCKGIEKEGEQAFNYLLELFPQLKRTYIERTKSGGYHLFFFTDLKENINKLVFKYPFYKEIEVIPPHKLEIEAFLRGNATMAPTTTYEGNYKALNNNPFLFLKAEELRKVFSTLRDNSISYEKIGSGAAAKGDYKGQDLTENDLKLLTDILELNGLRYHFSGKNIRVYGYDDGKNPDYRVNFYDGEFYLWNVKDHHARKPTLKEYIQKHRGYIDPEQLKFDKTCKVDKYLSESQEVVRAIQEDSNTLIVAPCGTGKSYTTINTLKENGDPFIFIVPNRSVKHQLAKEYDLDTTEDGIGLKQLIKNGSKQIVCCYESVRNLEEGLLRDYVLVIDEYHSLLLDLHYRDNLKLLELQKAAKRTLYLTATPQKLFQIYDKAIEVKSGYKVNATISVIKSDNERISKGQYAKFLNAFLSIAKAPTLLIFSTGIEDKKLITGREVIHSKNTKERPEYQELLKTGEIPKGFIASTNLFNAGLSLYNKGVVNLIIDFTGYDVNEANYIQMINRFRNAEKVNVIILKRNTKGLIAKERTVKETALKLVQKLNTGKATLREVYALNNPFRYCIDMGENGKFTVKEDMLVATKQLINGAKTSSEEIAEDIAKVNGWEYKGTLSLQEYENEALKLEKGKQTRTILQELFVEDGKINMFAYYYFMYRVNRNQYDKEAYKRELEKNGQLTAALQDPKVSQAIKRLVDDIKKSNGTVNDTLQKYFRITNKLDEIQLTPGNKQELTGKLLNLGEDNTRLAATRKLLAEHIEAFIPTYSITPNKQVKELLKYIGIKCKQDKKLKKNILSI